MTDDLRARLLDAAAKLAGELPLSTSIWAHGRWSGPLQWEGLTVFTEKLRDALLNAYAEGEREAASALAIRGQEHEETDDQARRDKLPSSERQPAAPTNTKGSER